MSDIKVRLIEEKDLDNLRKWKNANKAAFFYKKNITIKQQAQWFAEYLKRNKEQSDFMFIVEYKGVDVGCMGYRIIYGVIDIYNVILGNKEYEGKKIISTASKDLWKHLRSTYDLDIMAIVLTENTQTINWYLKNNWRITQIFEDHKILQYEG